MVLGWNENVSQLHSIAAILTIAAAG